MTPEFWAIIAVGVALATLTLNGHRRLNALLDRHIGRHDRDMAGLHERLDREGARLEQRLDRDFGRQDRHMTEIGERIGRVETGLGEARERLAYVEGLLEGLRDALVGKGLPEPSKSRRAGG